MLDCTYLTGVQSWKRQKSEEIRCPRSIAALGLCTTCLAMLRRLTVSQVLFAVALGIAGGMYIYQPIFEQYSRDQKELEEKLQGFQAAEEKKS
ncbi:protein PIGBOS1 isoform X1 [Microtus oregoni]|uniref:protein PIGBOS1 isoform X1 n=2 Tax=Arvicolinae TaxID=39087 RepID=UPI001BB1E4AA|nr:protein PIGBOS1 isoform X1 [Microtus oregoni]